MSVVDVQRDSVIGDDELVRRAHAARVYDVACESPLDAAPLLTTELGARVLLKREDCQPVFSFKLRGAYNRMVQLSPAQRARGVIAASAGNHAQGVALAAAKLDIPAVIVMPVTAPQLKIDAVRRLGSRHVEVVLAGHSYSETQAAAKRMEEDRGLVFVHPFDDLDVIAGQATVGLEILRQCRPRPHAVFVPIGGGGLAAGVATCLKTADPDIRVFGVQATDAAAMAHSLAAGRRITLEHVGLFADGTAVKQVGTHTFALCQRHLDGVLQIDTDALCAAIRDVHRETRNVPEPSGALAVAGARQYAARNPNIDAPLVAVVSGANMNFDRLRFIAARGEVGGQLEAVFAVTIPERRGSFRRFCAVLDGQAITEFNYRISDPERAHLFVGIRTRNASDRAALSGAFRQAGFDVLDLTDDELAKQHLRHMIGGRSPLAGHEHLCRFEFAEQPGALTRFLSQLDPTWNISLFHYRNEGADYGRILVGIQIPDAEQRALQPFLDNLGYRCHDETDNPAYRMLLRA